MTRLQLNTNAIPNNYNIEELFQLAMEHQIFIHDCTHEEPVTNNYSLMQLASMPFSSWAELIEIENNDEWKQ